MKIKISEKSFDDVMSLPRPEHKRPKRQNSFFGRLLKMASEHELKAVNFTFREKGMERLGNDEPCLYLMNHSSFIDLKIASKLIYPRRFNIVCTSDGFVGKEWLMRSLGCIPTKKFVPESALIRDMAYALRELNSSVLMYPEASYSFDGTATPLPEGLGKCIKLLRVPVVMIKTFGAFSRDPLYNGLKLRRVNVSAEVEYLLSPDETKEKSHLEINDILREKFTFDNFRWQQENNVRIDEPFRAEGLNRVLYKCPHCLKENCMKSGGTKLTCGSCGKEYELDEYGKMTATVGNTEFSHIPEWYAWERECVRKELEDGTYSLEADVDIYMMVNTDSVYKVGKGHLSHNAEGFRLAGCDGKLDYIQKPMSSYSLYSDYFWYEIGDMICIGNSDALYYCFPRGCGDVVAKTRLAAEELYKIVKCGMRSEKL